MVVLLLWTSPLWAMQSSTSWSTPAPLPTVALRSCAYSVVQQRPAPMRRTRSSLRQLVQHLRSLVKASSGDCDGGGVAELHLVHPHILRLSCALVFLCGGCWFFLSRAVFVGSCARHVMVVFFTGRLRKVGQWRSCFKLWAPKFELENGYF
jgi:hypothetical protein